MIWEVSDRICGKLLKAALPHLVESMERHGHWRLDSLVKERLLTASASTLDRLLKPIRSTSGSRRRRERRKSMGRQVPVRTYNDWNKPPPGYLEIDLVAHCGGPLSGSFIHSLGVTDVCTGWPDPNNQAVLLLARDQALILAGLEAIRRQLPFRIRGIDSDNDGVFIDGTLLEWTSQHGIELTRSRAYRSNDQAYIERPVGDRRLWEVAVLFHIIDAFRSSDVWLAHSRRYGDVKRAPTPMEAVHETARLGEPFEPQKWLAERKERLVDGLDHLAHASNHGRIPGGAIENGELRIHRPATAMPEDVD